MIDITVVLGNHAEALLRGIPKALVFFRRDRVGELCSLLFLQLFQPHVFQVCFSTWCLNLQRTQFASLLCIVPSTYSNQYSQPRSSPGRYDYNSALYGQWPNNAREFLTTSFFIGCVPLLLSFLPL